VCKSKQGTSSKTHIGKRDAGTIPRSCGDVNINIDVKNMLEGFSLVFFCSGHRPVSGCSAYGYELSVSVKFGDVSNT